MKNNFARQFSTGKKGEQLVYNYLTLANLSPEFNSNKDKKSEFDIKFKLGKKVVTIEVKLDWMSSKTNNIAVEFWNPKSNQPSGITATKADLWAVCIKDFEHYAVFVCKTESLRKHMKDRPGIIKENIGDGNSNIMLFKVEEFLKTCVRLDNMEPKKIEGLLKGILK